MNLVLTFVHPRQGAENPRPFVAIRLGEWSAQAITAVSWEKHDDPVAREAELFAEYERGSSSLLKTYGRLRRRKKHRADLGAAAA